VLQHCSEERCLWESVVVVGVGAVELQYQRRVHQAPEPSTMVHSDHLPEVVSHPCWEQRAAWLALPL